MVQGGKSHMPITVGYLRDGYAEQRNIIAAVGGGATRYRHISDKRTLYGAYHLLRSRSGRESYADARSLYRPLRAPAVDMIHTFNTLCETDVPWVVTYESFVPRNSYTMSSPWCIDLAASRLTKRSWEALRADSCRALIALSESAQALQERFLSALGGGFGSIGSVRRKMQVLHPPQELLVERVHVERKRHSSSGVRFLFVGRDFFRKGGDLLVDVLEDLRSDFDDFTLTIVSDLSLGVYASCATEQDAQRMKALFDSADWITWHEGLANPDVLRLCAEADVGVLPTIADTYGYSVLEMQASGLPVITTNVRALGEINDENVGWIIKVPTDPVGGEAPFRTSDQLHETRSIIRAQLKETMREILLDPEPEGRIEKGLRSLERIELFHDPGRYGERLNEIYRSPC